MTLRTHIPNAITLARLLGIPALVALLHIPTEEPQYLAAGFFLLLAATDLLDGYLARRWKVQSPLGALLDPLVDKLLILVPLITLVGLRSNITGDPWVPSVLVSLLLAREIWVTGLRGLAATMGSIVEASDLGKLKTFFQVLAVFFLILHGERLFTLGDERITAQYVGIQCLLTALIIGYWSGAEYTLKVFRGIGARSRRGAKPSRRLRLRAS